MIEPYGGRLVDREISEPERERRDSELKDLPHVVPPIDQLYDAEKIGIGAYSPLEGFMDSATLASVTSTGRLPNGLPWTIPIHFPVPEGDGLRELGPGDSVGLVDARGRLVGVLHIEECFALDRGAIARSTYA
ncbi:MAG: sulfate adenylyltransferase, partial [Candidatus Lutacidiplasmatales archaeon]